MAELPQSFDDAAQRIRAALASRAPRRLAFDGFAPAAVLVPVLRRPTGPTLLLTRRTDELRKHRGEISFPGGHVEGAEDARAAALREAREEVGLDPADVDLLGQLDDRPSTSRYLVTPLVGLVADPPPAFSLDRREVREAFEVPLARLLDPGVPRFEWWDASRLPPELPRRPLADLGPDEVDAAAGRYKVWFFDVAPGRLVWGLTARILRELLERAFTPR